MKSLTPIPMPGKAEPQSVRRGGRAGLGKRDREAALVAVAAPSTSEELSVELVMRAGSGWGPDPDFGLLNAAATVEHQLRAAEFAAIERMLPYIDSTSGPVIPGTNRLLSRFCRDLRRTGWWEDPPAGEPELEVYS